MTNDIRKALLIIVAGLIGILFGSLFLSIAYLATR